MKPVMKISGNQILWMLATMEFGATVLLTFAPTFEHAKQDVWIAALLSGASALFITYLAVKIGSYFPKMTFVEYTQVLFGKWCGRLIVVPYFIMLFSVIPVIMRQGADFITITLLQETPVWAVLVLIGIITVYVALSGIEGIARSSEFLGPFIYFLLLVLIVALMKDVNWHYVLPVYVDTGWKEIARGSVYMTGFLGEAVLLIFLYPFIDSPKGVYRYTLIGVGLAWLFLAMCIVIVLTLFGPDFAEKMWYPAYGAVRFVSLGGFVERIDPVGILIWLYSYIIKLSMYLFITAYSFSQWLKLKKWKRLIWLVVAVGIIGGLLPKNIVSTNMVYAQTVFQMYVLPINMVLIPLLVWIAAAIRARKRPKAGR
ncbi:GerAB/ArcD/ProY family transporter [Paenibacillus humicola]|uniref:GerAB/ArcD/ProY family transporter n=1 Tax=Paenibacillus humicola TaxID=3110540 RepID=UPI00237AF1BA|nr:endospore germination permease [Paenibacillus humicola]